MVDDEGPEGVRVKVYIGKARKQDYFKALAAYEGGTLSPGGVAAELRVSRQYVHQLLTRGVLEAWVYREKPNGPAHYCEITLASVKAYAERAGRGEPEEFGDIRHLYNDIRPDA